MSVINLSNIILASSSDCGIESLSPKSRSSPGAWLVNCVEATRYEKEREREGGREGERERAHICVK